MNSSECVRAYRLAGDRLQIGVCEPGVLVFSWSMWLIWPSNGMMTDQPTLVIDGDSWCILVGDCADFVLRLNSYSQMLEGRILRGEVMRDLRALGYVDLTGR